MSERIEDSVVVNAGKKSGAKKAAKAPAKPGTKRKRSKKASKAGKKATRRRGRKRNPSLDVQGNAMAAAGGFLAELVTTPAAHFAGKLVKDDGLGRGAVKGLAGGVVGVGLGLAVGMVSPAMGKGMSGVGGSQVARNALAGAAVTSQPGSLLQKAGFAVLPLPDGVYSKGSALYKKDAAGAEKLLLGFNVRPIELEMDDGSRQPASLLGAMGNDALIMDGEGEMRLLAGAMGAITQAYPNPQAGAITQAYPNPQAGRVGDYSEENYA